MIPLMREAFTHERETRQALADWLVNTDARLSMGDLCAAFESAFADWQGRRYAVLFNSGSSANLAILQALQNLGRLPMGSSVGFSALTWATNVMPLLQLDYNTVPLDVDPCTLNVMASTAAQHLGRLRALFITNALGYLPDLDHLRVLCEQHGVLLIEDNCESLGSELAAGKAGNFGIAASFSFFVAHHMSTIEGGMACTDDAELAEMLKMVRANGWDRSLTSEQRTKWRARYGLTSDFEAAYTFYVPAYNLRPTEITGFLGLQQLGYLDEAIAARIGHFSELETAARENDDLEVLDHDHMTRLSPFAFPVLCKTKELRDRYAASFMRAGVEIRPVIAGNIARQPFYRQWHNGAPLPGADRVERNGFYFGIYPELTPYDVNLLKACLRGENA